MFGIAGVVAGIILILLGIVFVYLMVGTSGKSPTYQPESFSVTFIVLGLIFMVTGAILIFV